MDKKETAKAIKVMQAWIDGEDVEYNWIGHEDLKNLDDPIWCDVTNVNAFDWSRFVYRVKPKEPLQVFMHINRKTGKVVGFNHTSETMHQDPKIIHKLFREVL